MNPRLSVDRDDLPASQPGGSRGYVLFRTVSCAYSRSQWPCFSARNAVETAITALLETKELCRIIVHRSRTMS